MSVEEADVDIYFGGVGATVTFALTVLFCVYFVSSRVLSGAKFVVKDYKRKKQLEDRYKSLFASRDNLLYHISRAKAKGEMDVVTQMIDDLENLDKRIDALEEDNSDCFKPGYFLDGRAGGRGKEKLKV